MPNDINYVMNGKQGDGFGWDSVQSADNELQLSCMACRQDVNKDAGLLTIPSFTDAAAAAVCNDDDAWLSDGNDESPLSTKGALMKLGPSPCTPNGYYGSCMELQVKSRGIHHVPPTCSSPVISNNGDFLSAQSCCLQTELNASQTKENYVTRNTITLNGDKKDNERASKTDLMRTETCSDVAAAGKTEINSNDDKTVSDEGIVPNKHTSFSEYEDNDVCVGDKVKLVKDGCVENDNQQQQPHQLSASPQPACIYMGQLQAGPGGRANFALNDTDTGNLPQRSVHIKRCSLTIREQDNCSKNYVNDALSQAQQQAGQEGCQSQTSSSSVVNGYASNCSSDCDSVNGLEVNCVLLSDTQVDIELLGSSVSDSTGYKDSPECSVCDKVGIQKDLLIHSPSKRGRREHGPYERAPIPVPLLLGLKEIEEHKDDVVPLESLSESLTDKQLRGCDKDVWDCHTASRDCQTLLDIGETDSDLDTTDTQNYNCDSHCDRRCDIFTVNETHTDAETVSLTGGCGGEQKTLVKKQDKAFTVSENKTDNKTDIQLTGNCDESSDEQKRVVNKRANVNQGDKTEPDSHEYRSGTQGDLELKAAQATLSQAFIDTHTATASVTDTSLTATVSCEHCCSADPVSGTSSVTHKLESGDQEMYKKSKRKLDYCPCVSQGHAELTCNAVDRQNNRLIPGECGCQSCNNDLQTLQDNCLIERVVRQRGSKLTGYVQLKAREFTHNKPIKSSKSCTKEKEGCNNREQLMENDVSAYRQDEQEQGSLLCFSSQELHASTSSLSDTSSSDESARCAAAAADVPSSQEVTDIYKTDSTSLCDSLHNKNTRPNELLLTVQHVDNTQHRTCARPNSLTTMSDTEAASPMLEEVHMKTLSPTEDQKLKTQQTCFTVHKSQSYNEPFDPDKVGIEVPICKIIRCFTCGQIMPDGVGGRRGLYRGSTSSRSTYTSWGTTDTSRPPSRVLSPTVIVEDKPPILMPVANFKNPRAYHPADLVPSDPVFQEDEDTKASFETNCLTKSQVLAPDLKDTTKYHAFFLYHNNDRDWVLNVIEKLECPTLGFRCCCYERDLASSTGLSQLQSVLYGVKNSLKTIVVLTPDFVAMTWPSCETMVAGETENPVLARDVIAVLLQDCELPNVLSDLPYIEAHCHGWWTKLLARLALPDETSISEEAMLSMSSSLVGLHPGLHSSYLLLSLKSQCVCCGKEIVDPTEVPDELLQHGIQIPEEEYSEVLCALMHDLKFRCHIWCYNMPLAIAFFTLLLVLCLVLIPIIESRYFFNGPETGLEFVHGGIVWLCVLTIYMIITHLTRRKMKESTYKSLAVVNMTFIKYNLLLGVENLGLADCNKYLLHFFYYELGPCLAYLQELLMSVEENTNCYNNHVSDGDVTIDMDCDDVIPAVSDRITVLENANITNASLQSQAEDLLLDHSGEYINLLITRKLDKPRKQRHVKGAYCLCQYVEQRVYKCVV